MLNSLPLHWRFFFLLFAAYVHREQQKAIEYLLAEREGMPPNFWATSASF